MKVQNISQYLDHLGSLNLYQQILGKQEARESPRAPQRSHPYMRSQHPLLLRHVALPPVGRSLGRSVAGRVSAAPAVDIEFVLLLHRSLSPSLPRLIVRPPPSPSSSLSVRPSLCLYISFAFSLSISPPSPSLSLTARPSLALFLHSFHAALGLPKRLGLNGENLLWYNELGEHREEG